jgi:probable phosphoglycerate mutase
MMTVVANQNPTRFYFLNHGETDWDRDGKLAGRINAPLNGHGIAEARRAGELLRGMSIKTICSSPQHRALTTAEIVAAQIHAPVVTLEGLKDCCFGSLDGAPIGGWLEAWRQGITPEGAEPLERFRRRALAAMSAALGRPGPVLIVAHPGIYEMFREAAELIEAPTWQGQHLVGHLPIMHEPEPRSRLGARSSVRWHATPLAA